MYLMEALLRAQRRSRCAAPGVCLHLHSVKIWLEGSGPGGQLNSGPRSASPVARRFFHSVQIAFRCAHAAACQNEGFASIALLARVWRLPDTVACLMQPMPQLPRVLVVWRCRVLCAGFFNCWGRILAGQRSFGGSCGSVWKRTYSGYGWFAALWQLGSLEPISSGRKPSG